MTRFSRISALLGALVLAMLSVSARTSLLNDTIMMQPLPVYDASHPQKIVRFTPIVSVGSSSVLNNYRTVVPGLTDMQTSPGFMLHAGLHVNFFIHRSLALTTGLEGSINNSRIALGIIDGSSNSIGSAYISHHYYEAVVPVYVSFRLNLGWRIKGMFGVGAYLGKGIDGTSKTSGYTSGINSLGQAVIDHLYYTRDYYSENMSVVNSVKDFDFGPRISAGFIFRHRITWNLVFQTSARNLAINHNVLDIKYRHISYALEVGYTF